MLVAIIKQDSAEENILLRYNRTSKLERFADKIPLVDVNPDDEPEIGTAWFIRDDNLGYFKLYKSNWDQS